MLVASTTAACCYQKKRGKNCSTRCGTEADSTNYHYGASHVHANTVSIIPTSLMPFPSDSIPIANEFSSTFSDPLQLDLNSVETRPFQLCFGLLLQLMFIQSTGVFNKQTLLPTVKKTVQNFVSNFQGYDQRYHAKRITT